VVLPKTLVDVSSPPNVANQKVSPIKKKFIRVDRKTAMPAAHSFWAAPPLSSVNARTAFGADAGTLELTESISSARSMSSSNSEDYRVLNVIGGAHYELSCHYGPESKCSTARWCSCRRLNVGCRRWCACTPRCENPENDRASFVI
jgi:hypothetical protein